MEMMELLLGTAKVDITPQSPMPLAGFGHRHGDFEGINHPLYLKVWFFEQTEASSLASKALLIHADILAWSTERTEAIQSLLFERFGLEPASIILHATHTHSGPRTLDIPDPMNTDYMEALECSLLEAVEEAYQQRKPVVIERGSGECQLGIHRRKFVDGVMTMAPNEEGLIDSEVSVIRFRSKRTNETVGVLIHYACHPTTTDHKFVSSEFPGIAMERVEQAIGDGAIASYLQGCCGDIRPALINGDAFYRGGDEEVQRLGTQLADVVLQVLRQPMRQLELGRINAESVEVQLPFESVPDAMHLQQSAEESGLVGAWGRRLLAEPNRVTSHIPLKLNQVTIANDLVFLAMNGEIMVEYGLFIKNLHPGGVLPLAYSNGMVGYIPTDQQLAEGGYEPNESIHYYLLPAPFSQGIEKAICDAASQLLKRTILNPDNPYLI
ncbi:neutral/alkaline non-lysosomal ceramidase N-terminal domain-containing protein [Paenibacillus qinlingensis]|uniref:Neutral/alkaline non-lysosomal ceramidase N-terminal domain-containing protein n=1 Tax=Paenibacillus qinlingensis TaxID=1837343 RepID=A0ABU1NSH8_9BACL|nr:neutral/alkaline non-lysosomal ceramidase N-terminal domain-containing protein [Paenibacillus qinlingensis]MDR6550435.1 hypothetical protein [Paenibacillus qinlingensis]